MRERDQKHYFKSIGSKRDKSAFRGDRLRGLRRSMEYNQDEFAALCGVTRTQIVNLEYRRTEPSIKTLVAICRLLGVSADYLLGLSNDPIR